MAMRTMIARPACARVGGVRVSRRSFAIRAQEQPQQKPENFVAPEVPSPSTTPATPVASTPILGRVQEAINGRAAMLGMTAAALSEIVTHQSVWSQIAGKYVNFELVEQPIGTSSLLYFFVVMLVTVASIAPKIIEGEGPDSRKFGPFTPGLENTLGRVAMLAFPLLLLTENVVHAAVF